MPMVSNIATTASRSSGVQDASNATVDMAAPTIAGVLGMTRAMRARGPRVPVMVFMVMPAMTLITSVVRGRGPNCDARPS